LPTTSVDDAVFQERDNALVIGTHGRGIWVLDDVGPLETVTPEISSVPATLLSISHARLMSTFTPQAWYGHGEFFAPNPDWNAVVQYNLRDAASGPAAIVVSDQSGRVVRTLKGPAAKGVNRVVWDLRLDPPVDSSNVPTGGGRGGGGGGRGGPPAAVAVGFPGGGEGGGGRGSVVGPLVMPGSYTVRVTVPGITAPMTRVVKVEADPLPKFLVADRAARQTVLMAIYDWTKVLGEARVAARALTGQRDSIKADLASAGAQIDSLNARIGRTATAIDRALLAVNAERGPIEGWSGQPTSDQRKAVGYAIEDARKAINDLNKLVTADVPAAYGGASAWKRKVAPVKLPARNANP